MECPLPGTQDDTQPTPLQKKIEDGAVRPGLQIKKIFLTLRPSIEGPTSYSNDHEPGTALTIQTSMMSSTLLSDSLLFHFFSIFSLLCFTALSLAPLRAGYTSPLLHLLFSLFFLPNRGLIQGNILLAALRRSLSSGYSAP